jgi:hypothetical protein
MSHLNSIIDADQRIYYVVQVRGDYGWEVWNTKGCQIDAVRSMADARYKHPEQEFQISVENEYGEVLAVL